MRVSLLPANKVQATSEEQMRDTRPINETPHSRMTQLTTVHIIARNCGGKYAAGREFPAVSITATGPKLLISLGSTNTDGVSEAVGAGIVGVDPLYPKHNFFYLWWRELLN